MKPLADAERWKARGLILSLDWADEPSLARRAEQWVLENSAWVNQVKWGQWEGLKRQGETARDWEKFEVALEDWFTDSRKKPIGSSSGKTEYPVRRAWDLPPLRPGQNGLKYEIMDAIEQASWPPKTKNREALLAFLDESGFPPAEQNDIDQLLRTQRARKFMEILLMKIKILKTKLLTEKETPDDRI